MTSDPRNESGETRPCSRSGRNGQILTGAALWLCLLIVASAAAAADRRAEVGEVSLSLRLLTERGAITAGEPLLARIELTGPAQEQVSLWGGNSTGPSMRLEVYNAEGKLLSATPLPRGDVGGIQRLWFLQPGRARVEVSLLSANYDFAQPGDYTVHARLLTRRAGGELATLCEDEAAVRVLPFDRARLEARCEELLQPIRWPTREPELPMDAVVKALYAVRHDIVLPYLDWMAREWGTVNTCLAIRRVGTPRAQKLIEDLAARGDRVGEAAREAMQRPLTERPAPPSREVGD